MNKKEYNSPRGKLLRKKLLSDYSFTYPNEELMNLLSTLTLPSSSHYNTNTRGKAFVDLTVDQLEHIGWENNNATSRDVFYSKMMFFIKLYGSKTIEFTHEDILEMAEEEFGIKIKATAKELAEEREYQQHLIRGYENE